MRTKENTLYLPIKQIYFDEILAGTKKTESREIKETTFKRYLDADIVDGVLAITFDEDLLSVDDFNKYPNEPFIYNNGVYPYAPKPYKYLKLAVGYNKDRDIMVVEVVDITFETLKYDDGSPVRYDINGVECDDGDLAVWGIVYHLGEIVETDLKKDRKSND